MTAGSKHYGHDGSNHHAMRPRDDRETLSALFDGELPGDAARFALKRLDHDEQWRDTCGRWQLIGDALRGEPVAFAPADFATGVTHALQREAAVLSDSPAGRQADRPTAGRRWIGGAVAASVAMAAVLAVRPYLEQPRSQPASAAPATIARTSPVLAAPVQDEPPAAALATTRNDRPAVATALANATASAPAKHQAQGNSRARPIPSQRVPSPRSTGTGPSISGATAIAATSPASASAPRPFMPPDEDIVTRPWPRAALPDATAAGALTVGFGSAPSPSFYPFEPRLPASEAPPPSGQEEP